LGSFSSTSPSRSRSNGTLTPACDSSGRVPPPCWSISATSRCTGSIMLWTRPTASDCASASACWKREVSLSIRMVDFLGTWGPAGPAMPFTCGRRPRETSLPPAPLTPTARLPPRLRGEAWGGGNPAATPSGTAPPPNLPPASEGRGSAPRPRHARLLPRPDIHAPATHLPPPLAGEGWGGGNPSSNAIWHRPPPPPPPERESGAEGPRPRPRGRGARQDKQPRPSPPPP